MRNRLLIVSALVLSMRAVVFYVFKKEEEQKPELQVNDLPMLSVKAIDSTVISLRDLPGKVILIYFNPECDHCQSEAREISLQKPSFKQYQVYFIASDSIQNIVNFRETYELTEQNFYFAQAGLAEVYEAVGPIPSVPAIYIYNEKHLVKRLEGQVPMEELIKYL